MDSSAAETNGLSGGETVDRVAEPKQPSDRIWDYKPWWCQPWSIVLTGVSVVAASWLVLHRLWVSGLVALPVLAWWTVFLVLYPRAMVQSGMLAEYRQGLSEQTEGDR